MPGLTGVEAARAIGAARASRLRHRLRPVRGAGLRAGRARLPREAGRASAPRRHRRAPAGAPAIARRARQPTRLEALLERLAARNCATRRRRRAAAAMDPRVGRQRRAPDPGRRRRLTCAPTRSTRWSRGDGGEALIRKPLKELADELDPAHFAQVHRSVVVNLRRVEPRRRAARTRPREHPPEGPRRGAAGEPQLPAPLPADVEHAGETQASRPVRSVAGAGATTSTYLLLCASKR